MGGAAETGLPGRPGFGHQQRLGGPIPALFPGVARPPMENAASDKSRRARMDVGHWTLEGRQRRGNLVRKGEGPAMQVLGRHLQDKPQRPAQRGRRGPSPWEAMERSVVRKRPGETHVGKCPQDLGLRWPRHQPQWEQCVQGLGRERLGGGEGRRAAAQGPCRNEPWARASCQCCPGLWSKPRLWVTEGTAFLWTRRRRKDGGGVAAGRRCR